MLHFTLWRIYRFYCDYHNNGTFNIIISTPIYFKISYSLPTFCFEPLFNVIGKLKGCHLNSHNLYINSKMLSGLFSKTFDFHAQINKLLTIGKHNAYNRHHFKAIVISIFLLNEMRFSLPLPCFRIIVWKSKFNFEAGTKYIVALGCYSSDRSENVSKCFILPFSLQIKFDEHPVKSLN